MAFPFTVLRTAPDHVVWQRPFVLPRPGDVGRVRDKYYSLRLLNDNIFERLWDGQSFSWILIERLRACPPSG